ncbi:probable glycosyltransferase At5g03795 [Salvia hispanica]|uniref:probable glycosyltransferase At5g03795 n=1 Tax=Salvia hispanica TaxID=49212 RepID=UPI0020095CB6|nr:probable glycosyltransferase At5g03795 [Salvia hispanica]
MAASAASFPSPPLPQFRAVQKDSVQGLFILLIISSLFFFLYSFSSTKHSIHPPKANLPLQQPWSHVMHNNPFISRESFNPRVDKDGDDNNHELPLPMKRGRDDDYTFHQRSLFMEDYAEMNKSMKIYMYPHNKNDPFANVLQPTDSEPEGNYASEGYFKKALFKSHFLTNDPSEVHLFYLPFSIASLRQDERVGIGGIQSYVKNYVQDISRSYPFWNRTGGADHFYVACHSVGRNAMDKTLQVKLNAIQVVCSSSYFLRGYVSHKDASIPQIWPRRYRPPIHPPSNRDNLAFYAGAMNSRVREYLVKTWVNDSEISVHPKRLNTSYSESLLRSKFCIHANGFEVNTARIGDALYYGCVPVILADQYDLPYADILNWESFSVVLLVSDIPIMKEVLREKVRSGEYLKLHRNVMRVQNHFQWHSLPVDYDAFYMVMYELWLRRSHVKLNI